ncbi:MAG: T9SS type A sorting domain-containing protein [Chitinophagaceae bacterium]
MKQVLTTFLILNCVITKAQVFNSSCTSTPSLVQLYRIDASRLAEVRLLETNSNFKDSIHLHQATYDTILNALIRLHNMDWSPMRDTIRNIFQFADFQKIYGFEPDSTHFHKTLIDWAWGVASNEYYSKNISFIAHNSTTWVSQWKTGNYSATNNADINNLVNRFNLQVDYRGDLLNNNSVFDIKGAINLNSTAIRNKLKLILPSITLNNGSSYSTAQFFGDGNRINFRIRPSFIEVDFVNACGDCPSGCTRFTIWTFRLPYSNCTVEYVSRSGAAQPGQDPFCLRGSLVNLGITNFYIQSTSQKNILNFTSNQNTSIKHYLIEKSENGINFTNIGSITPTNENIEFYSFTDYNINNSRAYYRIKTINNNNSKWYSQIVKTERSLPIDISILQTSNSKNIQLSFYNQTEGKTKISLYNSIGVKIWQNEYNLNKGSVQIPINLSEYSKGMYILRLECNGKHNSKTFIL